MSFTWTCPQCAYELVSGGASIPSNCPACNYPDAPTTPAQIARVREQGKLEVDDDRPSPAQQRDIDQAELAAAGAPIHGSDDFDEGWLAVCVESAAAPYLIDRSAFTADDWERIVHAALEQYHGERPTLLCGCPAGRHPNTIAAMQDAHPDRGGAN